MEFKFIVLALVISITTGGDTKVQPTDGVPPVSDIPIGGNINPGNNGYQTGGDGRDASPVLLTDGIIPTVGEAGVEPSKIHDVPDNTTTTTTTTTTEPTPKDQPWVVKNDTFVFIVAEMKLKFVAFYPTTQNIFGNVTMTVPENATAAGIIEDKEESIVVSWNPGNSFQVKFERTDKDKFKIVSFNLTLNTKQFSNFSGDVPALSYVNSKLNFPEVPVKMSYKCDKELKMTLVSARNETANLSMNHTRLEAFTFKKDVVFGEAKDCENFDTPDIVPIAVGCVLSILVIVVLAAYIIGRRRSQNRGYLSM